MTLKQKPEGTGRKSHAVVWEKSIPGRIAPSRPRGWNRNCVFREQPGSWWGWSRVSKGRVVRKGIREVARCEMMAPWGHDRKRL